MWINITKEVFEKSDLKSLNFLYQILSWYPVGSSARYNIVVDTEKVKSTDNFEKLSAIEESLEDFLNLEYSYFTTSSSNISYKITQKKAQKNFNLEEAILFFNQPISVILENNKNDSLFIRAIITHFGKIDGVNKAEEHLNNRWLQFENAGGCSNIPNFIESFIERFKKIADKNGRQPSDYFRGIIIIDSDREYPTQPSKHDPLVNKLEELGIDVSKIHLLEKRMMENYLPREVFEEIQRQYAVQQNIDLNDWLNVYLTLTDRQQLDYINISDGFPPKKDKYNADGSRKRVPDEILTLFSLSDTDLNFQKLDKGLKFQGFDERSNLKTWGSFKDEFPNLFRKPIVNKQTLEARDGSGELQRIADKINQLL